METKNRPKNTKSPRDACDVATGGGNSHRHDGSDGAPPEQAGKPPRSARRFPDKPPSERWTLAQVTSKCRVAAAVYLALIELTIEKKSAQVRTNRNELFGRTGLGNDAITAAVHTLAEAGWILGRGKHKPGMRWYQITVFGMGKNEKSPPTGLQSAARWAVKSRLTGIRKGKRHNSQTPLADKTPLTGKSVKRKNALNGIAPLEGKLPLTLLRNVGGGPDPLPAARAGLPANIQIQGVGESEEPRRPILETLRAAGMIDEPPGARSRPNSNGHANGVLTHA